MITPTAIPASDVLSKDTLYQYRYWKYDEKSLLHSIREHGIVTPLIMEKIDTGFRIVHGFRRFSCAQILKMKFIPGIITEKPGLTNLKDSLIDNRVNGPFNVYEQSQAISVAHNLGASTSQIISEFLPLLGLNAHKNVYDDYSGFHRLPQALIDFFVDKDISVSRSLAFQRLDEKGLEISLNLLENFSPGINVLHEIVTHLYELSRRDDKSVEEIYNALAVQDLLEKYPQSHLALRELRTKILQYRYPVLTETNRELQQLADKLALPSSGRIQWDKKLEKRGVIATFHWERLEDVKKSIDSLSGEKNLGIFQKIFNKI